MKITQPILPGLHLSSLRKKPRSTAQKLLEEKLSKQSKTIAGLKAVFGRFIPSEILRNNASKHHSRSRVYSKENTFWIFLSQIFDADGGCSEAVRKMQTYLATQGEYWLSTSTGSYCKSRAKLKEEELAEIFDHTATSFEVQPEDQPLNGRRVVVVDGTGLSMPDTKENQAEWPQSASQKKGCGFPTARLLGLFDLASGGLLSYALGSKKSHELPLLRKQHDVFRRDDIFLGDKGFCSFFDIYKLQKVGVDSVITLARRIPKTDETCVKKLGKDDLLIHWKRPAWHKKAPLPKEEWNQLPKELLLRQIKVTIDRLGFRSKSFYIITTLHDSMTYPAKDLAELYLRRWSVELFFRDQKTTLKMDILRCKTPDMIRKELLMNLIAYNAIRHLIYEAARAHEKDPMRISFKGALQALRQAEFLLHKAAFSPKEIRRLRDHLERVIADDIIPYRPGRSEPRCLKRRPKPFQLLTKPRHEMVEIKHRSKYHAKVA
jgi:hypothetical protein